jgi:hypothetical protein
LPLDSKALNEPTIPTLEPRSDDLPGAVAALRRNRPTVGVVHASRELDGGAGHVYENRVMAEAAIDKAWDATVP